MFSCGSRNNGIAGGLGENPELSHSFGSMALFSYCRAKGEDTNPQDFESDEEDRDDDDDDDDGSSDDLERLQSCFNGTAAAAYFSDEEINADLKAENKKLRHLRKQEKKRNMVLLPPSFSTGSISFTPSVYDYTEEEMLMPVC